MNTITADIQTLLVVIRDNRTKHRAVFEEALEGFRAKAVEELDRIVADLRAGRMPAHLYVSWPRPEDHTKDYDRVIRMLTMHTGPTIDMTESDFAMYVMDDWAWKAQFMATASNYTRTA